ncbi:MAG TPA: hypothetical protein VLB75_01630 [Steroidobacteraceae bacterium]|nr:hypothetical protein [Steroidobacteraceae bacterium]
MKTFLAGVTLAAGLTVGHAAMAQDAAPDAGDWKWDVTLYMLGASMDGTTGVEPLTADIDVGFDDILDNLEFGAMGRVRAARDPWSIGLDVIYMGLGASSDRPPSDIDVDQTAIELSVGFRYNDYFESIVGVRYNDLSVDVRFQGPLGLQSSPSIDWWDPFLGANVRAPLGEKWSFCGRADIGGFGVGSELAWQIEALFDWRLSARTSFQIGYRWIDIDYEDDDSGFIYDILTQGPQAGVTWRF